MSVNNPGSQYPLYGAYPIPAAYSLQSTSQGFSNSRQENVVYQRPFAEQPNTSQVNGVQIPAQPSLPPQNYVQMLEQELAISRRRNQEYENTIIHQANFISQTLLYRHSSILGAQGDTAGILPSNYSNHAPRFDPLHATATLPGTPLPPPSWLGMGLMTRPNPPNAGQTSRGPSILASEVTKRQRDWTDGGAEIAPKRGRHTSLPTSTPSQPNSVLEISPPPRQDSPSSHSTSTNFDDASTSSHSSKPDWSVEYNSRTVEVNLMRTITDEQFVHSIRFSPDGQLLAIIARRGRIVIVYDVETGAKICQLEDLYVREDPPWTHELCFSSNGKYLATCTGGAENVIRVWEFGKKHVRNALKGHVKPIYALNFSPNGRLLISGSYDTTVRIWNMRDGSSRIFDNSSFGISSACFSSDGRHVAAGNYDAGVFIWALRSGHLVASLKGHYDVVESIVFTPNGEGLITTSSYDEILKYWDISGLISQADGMGHGATDNDADEKKSFTFVGHEGMTKSISISPNGQWLATGSNDHTVRIWNTTTGAQQCILQAHKEDVLSVHFSPAGDYLASAGNDGHLRIWSYKQA